MTSHEWTAQQTLFSGKSTNFCELHILPWSTGTTTMVKEKRTTWHNM